MGFGRALMTRFARTARATGCRFREAREEAGREESRYAGLVGNCGDGGCARAVAYPVRPGEVDANPPPFACDGSVAPRPRSIDITRRLTTTPPATGRYPATNASEAASPSTLSRLPLSTDNALYLGASTGPRACRHV